ncbi:glutathionylspermidine synthase family protein [Sulfurospirillum oryzae]|uniref:glutathionylspermidine synthase family protein n=1 Tax=Sulfurospirillum oryzae TaxID=2976535 RepID=UPI0021E820BC|nr:glutathionylspermidine synthase family protein [Sulfurospirillum oryzae]
MLHVEKIKPLSKEFLESIGFYWHTDADQTSYVADELVLVSNDEVEAYYAAANELYDMFAEAGQYVIDNNLFHELNIPFNLVELIKNSWSNDVHWHLYGRFDFAGGVDGKPIKLIEFNADTPTSLYETAIIQWAMLKANGMDEAKQFNTVFEALKENFKRLVVLGGNPEDFAEYYEGWKILFSSIRGNIEDENTTRLLQTAANEAGFHTDFAYVDKVGFSGSEGIFKGDENFEYWFKLVPWENIAIEEGDLALLLDEIVREQKAIILNPAYTLLFQSKAFMKVLWDLFPNHPLLLETSFDPLKGKKQVEKRAFGREGANTIIYDSDMSVMAKTEGEYGNFKPIYQAYAELPRDSEGQSYQAGVFFAYEGCGLGFRRGGLIMENFSKFVGHRIKD